MISIEEGKDYIIEDRNELPYQVIGNLGHGHSGNVEKIRHINTGEVYACKTIRIFGGRLKDSRKKIFDNEIKIIRSLAGHHHVIRVFATYVSKREVGLILQPVADQGDLEDFIGSYSDVAHTGKGNDPNLAMMTSILERAFGCLASGLAFMHKQRIRHKDVKPRNILVHNGSVVYTDFGYSLDSSQLDYSTTYGRPDFLTRRYSAPEVIDHDRRNSSSDVYSLGCVFLDLLAALTNSFEVQSDRCFYEVIDVIFKQVRSATIPPRLLFLVSIIFNMTLPNLSQRLPAREATDKIVQHSGFSCHHCRPSLGSFDPSFGVYRWGSIRQLALERIQEKMASLNIEPAQSTETPRKWQEQNKKQQDDHRSKESASTRNKSDPASTTSTLVDQGLRALVLYDYEAVEDNEIDINENEYVIKIDQVDEDWWIGTNSKGKDGLFPANYVELIDEGNTGASQPQTTTGPPAVQNQPVASSTSAKNNKPTATALYDYEAAEDNEIDFPEGATITNLEFPDEDWWWGDYKGKSGLFPANYVQLDD